MGVFILLFGILIASVLLLLLAGTFGCYRYVFVVGKRANTDPHVMLPGEQYAERKEEILRLVDEALAIPYTDVYTVSHDGYRLHGRYYETAPGAPVEIQVHGYKSMAIRDFAGGLQLALSAGHNVLLIDQRAHGESEGRCLTFGVLERRDCLSWVNWLRERNGEAVRILLVGVSMGAATVLMAAGLPLSENVVGVVADSAYTSPKEIICKVIRDRRLSPALVYPFVRLGARLFGRFDLEEGSAETALKAARVPVLFIHGEADRFVPCDMSRANYAACGSEKRLLTVTEAGHGLGCLVDGAAYREALDWLFSEALYVENC